jgi:uncharacterized protein YkwD
LTAVVLALVPTATAQAQLPVPLPVPPPPAPSATAPAPTLPAAPAASGCAGAGALPASVPAAAVRSAVLCLLNVQRRAHGLPALRASRPLRVAATRWARTMVRGRFFDHARRGSTLSKRVARTAYLRRTRSWALGENIAYGGGPSGTAAAIVSAWMGSPPHRANILLRRFRDIGIGVSSGLPVGGSGLTYVTDFGVRR